MRPPDGAAYQVYAGVKFRVACSCAASFDMGRSMAGLQIRTCLCQKPPCRRGRLGKGCTLILRPAPEADHVLSGGRFAKQPDAGLKTRTASSIATRKSS